MKSLVQGQNTPLSGTRFNVSVGWNAASASTTLDISAFLLTSSGKVSGDQDMIFYGQPESTDGSIAITSDSTSGGGSALTFSVDASKLPLTVDKVAFTATTPAATSPPLSTVNSLNIELTQSESESAAFDPCGFTVDTQTAQEAAMILGELYRRGPDWKFRAVGQGFVGGLAPLAEHFGVEVDDPGTQEAQTPPVVEPEVPTAPAEPTVRSEPAVSLSKVSLSKAKPSISLEKRGSSLGEIRVNLNWNQKIAGKGLFGQIKNTSIDLDLCCIFALKDGSKGAVQALGQNFGSYDNVPWIHLLGDDRTGGVSEGEWMRINGARWDNIERVVIFALIYEGVPDWASTDGVVSLYVPDHPLVESPMDGQSKHRVCAVATLENDNGGLKMTQENRYFKSAKELDEHYGIGLSWTAGRK